MEALYDFHKNMETLVGHCYTGLPQSQSRLALYKLSFLPNSQIIFNIFIYLHLTYNKECWLEATMILVLKKVKQKKSTKLLITIQLKRLTP